LIVLVPGLVGDGYWDARRVPGCRYEIPRKSVGALRGLTPLPWLVAAHSRYIGIDCFGAETPEASLKGQRVYCADKESDANEVDGVMTFT